MVVHTATLRTLGGSVSLTLPATLIKHLDWEAGQQVSISSIQGGLMLTPLSRRKYTAADLVAIQGNTPLIVDTQWDTLPAIGGEASL